MFAVLIQTDEIAVIRNQRDVLAGQYTSDLVAKIPVRLEGQQTRPRSIATTPDRTRAYVTLAGNGSLAVVDTQTLQVVDLDATTEELDLIALPEGASPFWMDIDSRGQTLYVTDDRQPLVYIVDIVPGSPSFQQVVGTLEIPLAEAPSGLRGLAVNADDTRLYVAAPNSTMLDRNATGGNSSSSTSMQRIGRSRVIRTRITGAK